MNGTVQSDPSQNLWRTPKGDRLLGRGPFTVNKLIKQFDLVQQNRHFHYLSPAVRLAFV